MDTAPRPIPLRAIPLALATLAVPGVGAVLVPEWLQDDTGLLLWLTPILPAFLLAYYRGWRGAALALAFGMASLAVANVALLMTGSPAPSWPSMMAIVIVYLVLSYGVAALTELLERERRAVERLAFTDPLTALPNRRSAEEFLARCFDAARRGQPLSVILFDLDRFKQVNDRFGHATGDEVLGAVAEVCRRHTRGMDLFARFGGEEFLAVLPGSPADAARVFAERVRAEVAGASLSCGSVTVSAGVAEYEPGMADPEILLAQADRALYAAKEAGRDRVLVWQAPLHVEPERKDEVATDRPARILVVDDDPLLERAVAKTLDRMGFDAHAAGGPRGALVSWLEPGEAWDLLLTDVVMPEMSGPTLVDRLVAEGHRPRVVYMSGYLKGEVRSRFLPGGHAQFIEKPIDFQALAQMVRGRAPASLDGATV